MLVTNLFRFILALFNLNLCGQFSQILFQARRSFAPPGDLNLQVLHFLHRLLRLQLSQLGRPRVLLHALVRQTFVCLHLVPRFHQLLLSSPEQKPQVVIRRTILKKNFRFFFNFFGVSLKVVWQN